nr:pyruvate, phosphate dikinase regulatory protein, chloroplastic [Tanacetum cinerariifolium]
MVNSCLKKLKFHLASFDMVVKERTTATAITEGTWGFEHTKACFRDDIIPFVKNLKELFTSFDQCFTDEAKDTMILKLKEKFNSLNGDVKDRHVKQDVEEIEILNIELDHKVTKLAAKNEHLKQIYKQLFDSIKSSRVQSKEQSLKEQLSKLKGKAVLTKVVSLNPIDPALLQRDIVSSSESALTFAELFETNELKAQIQKKDTVILKLKEKIKSSSADDKERNVESKVEDIETQNLELDHRVTKLTAENNHLKQTYKQLFDSIKSSRVQSKEQCDDLINKVNLKSVEVANLNASL